MPHKKSPDQMISGPSSGKKIRETVRENDDSEVARRLQTELDKNISIPHRSKARDTGNDVHEQSKPSATTKAISSYPEPINEALQELHHWAQDVIASKCHKCRTSLLDDFAVDTWFKGWIEKSESSRTFSVCAALCPKASCKAMTCVGCGREPRTKKYTATCNGMRLDWCCQQGRLFAFWVALCKYDEAELQGQIVSEAKLAEHKAKAAAGFNKPKGTGYVTKHDVQPASGWEAFMMGGQSVFNGALAGGWSGGYADRGGRGNHTLSFQSTDKETDAAIGMILNVIVELLPVGNDTNKKVPPALQAMIQLSILLDKVADMLRNDSLRNVSSRAKVYIDVFEFVKRLGKNDQTSHLVSEQRYLKKRSSGLQVISARESFDYKGKGNLKTADERSPLVIGASKDDMATSVVGCMAKLASQAESLVDATKGGHDIAMEFNTKEGKATIDTAKTVRSLNKALAPLTYESRHSKKSSGSIARWDAYHEKHRLDYDPSIDRYLCAKISQLAYMFTQSPTNRIRRIVSEQVEMSTGLPQHIFLKVHDSRPDIMKCLMVGPGGTPYEGGLFEFDILCPEHYPFQPPYVQFLTTGQGTAGFNPNLYADGKVCLSLIGTWDGPPESKWQPNLSTLASVLTSIQAFILTSNPLENEPGYERASTALKTQNRTYSDQCQAFTIRFAILDWLQRPEMRNGPWKDVVGMYFSTLGERLLANVRVWAKSNPFIEGFQKDFVRGVPSACTVMVPPRFGGLFGGGRGPRDLDLVKELEKALGHGG